MTARETSHHVEMFFGGSFLESRSTWGWQCFTCGAEEHGFSDLPTAEESGAKHADEVPA